MCMSSSKLSDHARSTLRQQKSIIAALKEADISIRRRALDLLFTMCNQANVAEVVEELLKYLVIADFTMREEIVLKTAVLAERCAHCLQAPSRGWACCQPSCHLCSLSLAKVMQLTHCRTPRGCAII